MIGAVAERAGASIATLSRVVNGRNLVAPTTLSRVRAVIDNLGSTLSMVPALIFYAFAERQIMSGLTAGAVKE